MADRKGHRHNRTPPRRQQTLTSKPATIFTQSTSARKLPLVSTLHKGTHTGSRRPSPTHVPTARHTRSFRVPSTGLAQRAPRLPLGTPKPPGRRPPRKGSWPACRLSSPHSPLLQPAWKGQAVLHPRPSSPSPATRHPGKRWDPGHHASVENEDDIDRRR